MLNKNTNNFSNFIFYVATIASITFFFILLLTIKNECLKTQNDIEKLNNNYTSNLNIVKELQSNKEYFLSKEYIETMISNNMVSIAPETLLIYIKE